MIDTTSLPRANGEPQARFWALIPCAGRGSRAGSEGPKQYQVLAGQPMVMHTLAAFAAVARLAQTLVVVAPGDNFFQPRKTACLVADCGGATRASSVSRGLEFLLRQGAAASDWVLVHDAARCLVTPAQVNTLINACQSDPVGGLLAHSLSDTLKASVGDRVRSTLERADKWLAQTPQMFRIGMLMDALAKAGDQVTDESSAIELAGFQPRLVAASAQNFKLTYAEDFALAEAVLSARAKTPDAAKSESGTGLREA